MATATAGVQSTLDVEGSPVVQTSGALSKPHVWTYIWFILALLTIFGFHLRVFGHPVPPAANFP